MTEIGPRYDASYYRTHMSADGSMPYERNQHWLTFFGGVADDIVRRLEPTSVLDAGCAHGFLVEALVARGVDARGFDGSDYAISQAAESIRDRVWVASITEPLEGRFDLVTCIEVVEHLPPAEAGRALERITSVTDKLLLSTTPEDFEEPTHLNVQPPEYWAEMLAGLGFFRDSDFDASFLTPWASLFRRQERPELPALVREFERESWRLRQERNRLRAALLEASQTAGGSPADALTEVQSVAENLRHDLRLAIDAARGAQAERGAAMARAAKLENELAVAKEREKEFVDLVAQIDHDAAVARRAHEELLASRSYRLLRKALAPYRRLRARR